MPSDTEIRRLRELQTAPRCVLFVEDNPVDFEVACRELQNVHLANRTKCVRTADEMLEYLRGMDAYLDEKNFPMPAVIIIDQRSDDGLEAQQMLRSQLRFRHIPVVAISSSDEIDKLRMAMELGADAWMTKPFTGEHFRRVARELKLPLKFEPETAAAV